MDSALVVEFKINGKTYLSNDIDQKKNEIKPIKPLETKPTETPEKSNEVLIIHEDEKNKNSRQAR